MLSILNIRHIRGFNKKYETLLNLEILRIALLLGARAPLF